MSVVYVQRSLFEPVVEAQVDAPCPIPPSDGRRIQNQLDHTRRLMQNGLWWTLDELCALTGASGAGQSARIRDLRKHPYRYRVERRRVSGQTNYEYRLVGG
jgi:hypothetical protein